MRIRYSISLFLLLALFLAQSLNAQISPGDLAEVHAHLEGNENCTKCHTLGDKVTNDKCLACHSGIDKRIQQNRGYHASYQVKGKDCYVCHNDHHGRNFDIIRFDPDTFNHDLTGYQLQGAHNTLDCKSCHQKDYLIDQDLKEKDFTYLGLGTSCLSCHEDYHQGTLDNNCLFCHNYEQFSPASGFDHSLTAFPLKGKHREVECIECHEVQERNGKKFQRFSGVAHNNCTDCHEDPHNNRFGQNCTQCHTEQSFHIVKGMENFNHDKTDFPLEGLHKTVDCESCHKENYTTPIPHRNCMDCHADYHEGQFTKASGPVDCADCHTVNGFESYTFTLERHQQTDFPLEGAHMATPCFACHLKDGAEKWQFRDIGESCNDCHEDIHETHIDEKYYPDADCKSCHNLNRWNLVEFDHDLTGYTLEGAHREQSCRDCHFVEKEDGDTQQRFGELTTACTECHRDVHYGQFEKKGENRCLRCHTYTDWTAEKFDHDNTEFPLEGKHKEIECSACHKEIRQGNVTYVLYKIPDYRCEACH